ncbi:MAG: biotin transporter BioY [Clostridia bacterium]
MDTKDVTKNIKKSPENIGIIKEKATIKASEKTEIKTNEKTEQENYKVQASEKAELGKGLINANEKAGNKASKKIGITTKKITYVALATAVTIVLSLIAIPLPFTPIPFTMSVFAIFLVSSLLPPSMAVLAQIVYIFIGIIGIPVFSKFTGGFSALIGPTGGFLMAYPIMAFVISIFAKKKKVIFAIIGMVLALGICYLIGGFWLNFVTKMGIAKAMAVGVVPYIIPDLVKLILATIIVKTPYVKRISLN